MPDPSHPQGSVVLPLPGSDVSETKCFTYFQTQTLFIAYKVQNLVNKTTNTFDNVTYQRLSFRTLSLKIICNY